MFIRSALNGWLVPSVLLVFLVGALTAVVARNGCNYSRSGTKTASSCATSWRAKLSSRSFARCSTKAMLNGALP